MSKHSVPCRRFSDKDGAVFVSGDSSVHFSVPLFPHLGFVLRQYHDDNLIRSPWSMTAIPEGLVNPYNSLCKKNICRNDLKSPPFVPILPLIQASKEVRTFGRSSAHFREKYTRDLDKIQVHFTLKTVLRPSLRLRKPSHCIGAHFWEKSIRGPGGNPLLRQLRTQGFVGSVLCACSRMSMTWIYCVLHATRLRR
jgi:hypothetical protein